MTAQYDHLIQSACSKHLAGYDWRMFKAQMQQESQFNPRAVSPAGAGGLMQIMPATFAEWGAQAGYEPGQRFDPEASIFTGAMYMAYLLKQWKSPRPEVDRTCLALASYNAGLGSLLAAQREAKGALLYREIITGLPAVTKDHSRETIGYVRKILEYWAQQVTG